MLNVDEPRKDANPEKPTNHGTSVIWVKKARCRNLASEDKVLQNAADNYRPTSFTRKGSSLNPCRVFLTPSGVQILPRSSVSSCAYPDVIVMDQYRVLWLCQDCPDLYRLCIMTHSRRAILVLGQICNVYYYPTHGKANCF